MWNGCGRNTLIYHGEIVISSKFKRVVRTVG